MINYGFINYVLKDLKGPLLWGLWVALLIGEFTLPRPYSLWCGLGSIMYIPGAAIYYFIQYLKYKYTEYLRKQNEIIDNLKKQY